MNRFLLKNDTTENVSARVTVSPSDELGNLGHDAAIVIEGDRLTTCLAPTAVALPEPTGHRSQCFELNDGGRYAVEINGVVQPYAFTPADLLDCFNGQHESSVRFLECTEDKCAGAINKLLFWGGDGADITQCTVSAIALDGQEVFGLSEGGLLDIDRATDNLIVWFSEDSLMYGFGHFINKDPNNTHRVAVCYEGVDVATIKSYFVDTDNPTLTIKAITSTKAIEMFPENFSPEGQYSDLVLVEFCLSPAEPKPEISCDGAISSVSLLVDLYWQGESGAIVRIADDETGERITDIQGYYVDHFNPDRDTMAKMANVFSSGDYFVVTGGAMDDFDSATDPYGQRHYRQTITISNKRQQPTRIRIEVNGLNDEGFSRSKVEIVDPLNPTYFVLDDTETDMVVSKVCLAAARPEIVCDGAAPVFEAKTSFETNVIEVSVDGGPWVDIYSAEGIYVSFMPGNPGADIRFNLEGSDPKRVRVRTSRDIGLYVNPLTGFDQINTNKAYTLYDRNGVMIDPFDPNNHDHSGTEFDDTTSTDDYAVFFAEAEFCLALEPEETLTIDAPFLEYKANPTFSSMFSKMSMEYNGKVYTSYHIGFGSSLRSPLLSMLQGSWTAEDGEVITPIGSHIGYEDVYGTPRHYKVVDTGGNLMISGFGDNTQLPNLTFTEDPATMRFIITPETGIAPPPEQPEREWVDLIDVYGVDRGSVGDIHFDIEIKTMGYLQK